MYVGLTVNRIRPRPTDVSNTDEEVSNETLAGSSVIGNMKAFYRMHSSRKKWFVNWAEWPHMYYKKRAYESVFGDFDESWRIRGTEDMDCLLNLHNIHPITMLECCYRIFGSLRFWNGWRTASLNSVYPLEGYRRKSMLAVEQMCSFFPVWRIFVAAPFHCSRGLRNVNTVTPTCDGICMIVTPKSNKC